jgi:hypothetical protein
MLEHEAPEGASVVSRDLVWFAGAWRTPEGAKRKREQQNRFYHEKEVTDPIRLAKRRFRERRYDLTKAINLGEAKLREKGM